MYLVYLKYWTLNLMPLMVYPAVLFSPNFTIKEEQEARLSYGIGRVDCLGPWQRQHNILGRICAGSEVSCRDDMDIIQSCKAGWLIFLDGVPLCPCRKRAI